MDESLEKGHLLANGTDSISFNSRKSSAASIESLVANGHFKRSRRYSKLLDEEIIAEKLSESQEKAILINHEPSPAEIERMMHSKRSKNFLLRTFRLWCILWDRPFGIVTVIMVLQIGLAIAYAWAYNTLSGMVGDIVASIEMQDKEGFIRSALKMTFAAAAGAAANSLILALGDFLCLNLFRGALVTEFTRRYMERCTYYKMVNLDRRIDDPDQRMSIDILTFCQKTQLVLFGTPMYVGYIGTIASTLYFLHSLVTVTTGYFVPLGILIMFITSAIVSRLLSNFATNATKELEDANSSFSFLQTYFRLNSESIAFLGGHEREAVKMLSLLRNMQNIATKFCLVSLPMNFFTTFFYWGNQLSCYLIPALAWLWNHETLYTDRIILWNTSSYAYSLFGTLTTFLLLSQELSALTASTIRVSEFMENMDEVGANTSFDTKANFVDNALSRKCDETDEDKIKCFVVDGNATDVVHHPSETIGLVEVDDLVICRPGDQNASAMLEPLNFRADADNNIVISGPSGVGKSSILRVIGGLWPACSGKVKRPLAVGRGGLLFLPQRPYLTIGTLLDQITYPEENVEMTILGLRGLLDFVALGYLVDQFGVSSMKEERDWTQVLSLGEQQRLGLVRVFYHRPSVAILDESTSAIDEPTEALIYEAIRKSRITMLSVAHRSSAMRFHENELRVSRDGSYQVLKTRKSTIHEPMI